jgi:hypothetical protein
MMLNFITDLHSSFATEPAMKISIDILSQIIGQSDPHFEPDGTRRSTNRIPINKRAALCRAGSKVRTPITLTDLGNAGIGFFYAARPANSERIVLHFADASNEPVAIDCMVCWTKDPVNGRCRVGVEFLSVLEKTPELQPVGIVAHLL